MCNGSRNLNFPYNNTFVVLTRLMGGIAFPKGLRTPVRALQKRLISAEVGDDPKPLVHDMLRCGRVS